MSDDDRDEPTYAGPEPGDHDEPGGYWPPEPRSDVGARLPGGLVRASTGHCVEV